MGRSSWVWLACAATISVIAAAAETPAKGWVYATEKTVLREKPAANAKELARAPAGFKLSHDSTVRDGAGAVTWYRIYHGVKTVPAWVEASSVTSKRTTAPPPLSALDLKETGLGLKMNEADVASAFRGFDDLVIAYVQSKQELGDAEYSYALADYGGSYRLVNRKMRDVPGDGKTIAADKKVAPNGYFPDRTADGRKAAAEAFAKELE